MNYKYFFVLVSFFCISFKHCSATCEPVMFKYRNIDNQKEIYNINDKIIYSCKYITRGDGFMLNDKLSLVGDNEHICTSTGWQPNTIPECKVIRCPFPAIQNGEITYGMTNNRRFYYKDEVSFKCKLSYEMVGIDKSSCQLNKTWVPPIPKCKPTKPIEDVIVSEVVDFEELDNNEFEKKQEYFKKFPNATDEYHERRDVVIAYYLLSCMGIMFIVGCIFLCWTCINVNKQVYDKL
ncbi:EEV type-1 membrane glycoprotein [Hypsugopox virus]|nr:EEV type-1 membrane glycoprotein [Hypsugopox virus]